MDEASGVCRRPGLTTGPLGLSEAAVACSCLTTNSGGSGGEPRHRRLHEACSPGLHVLLPTVS